MVARVLIQKRRFYTCDSSIKIEKASIYTMNALKKLSELWHTSVNRKARPVVEGEQDKSWNDHVASFPTDFYTFHRLWVIFEFSF